jgi:broad specificity phosphatase PhoE
MNNIWLIRHGECHSNTGEKTTHPATSILTETGILQSNCIADCINFQPDIIIHSPYLRTLQSAQPTINKFPGATVNEWPVQEFIYLPHEKYLNSTQVDRQAAVDEYWQQCDPQQKNSDEAESFVEFIDRMEILIEKLKQSKSHFIMFTHGHVIRAMIWKIITDRLKKDKTGMAQYRSLRHALYIPNAAILKINLDEPELWMSQLITAHLKSELLT